MKPEKKSIDFLGITRSKAKMFEFNVPLDEHINPSRPLTNLLDLTIGILGDLSSEETIEKDDLESLLFTAQYFDALHNSQLADGNEKYLKLLGACAYFLADQPGSSNVLIKDLDFIDEDAHQLDLALLRILKNDILYVEEILFGSPYDEYIYNIYTWLNHYNNTGDGISLVREWTDKLRGKTIKFGSDREVLLGDLIYSVCDKYLKISSWNSLPTYSDLSIDLWRPYLIRTNSIKVLWPSQTLLGSKEVLKGKSAIIQMPTSAGKTKSAELIIRSAFLSGRASTAVIVAPFKALCQEIYNSLYDNFKLDEDIELSLVSDVLQIDIEEQKTIKQILILTPEKFEFILRHNDELVEQVGLIVYDEGHLLDDSSRGAKYELLLASVKRRLKPTAQVILISAVLPNAEDIAEWLISNKERSIQARNLVATSQSLAFVSWKKGGSLSNKPNRGILRFVDKANPDKDDFFVPRVLEQQQLANKPKERSARFFPREDEFGYNSGDIAALLSCKLTNSGTVAIFVGSKISANAIAKNMVDAFDRGLNWIEPSNNCDQTELERIKTYITNLVGAESVFYNAISKGVLLHHASVPHGLRLSVEYALQKQHCSLVICTSTLAQGVNLPIRYLIVTTDKQGANDIKIRDFHNLLGRAGRAGVYTEGTIIFSNPLIYDRKKISSREGDDWKKVKKLLNPDQSEDCVSHILTYFKKPESKKEEDWEKERKQITSDINSFLLNILSDDTRDINLDVYIEEIVKNTLAYSQVPDEYKLQLVELFQQQAAGIIEKEPDAQKRKFYAKSILDLETSQEILDELVSMVEELSAINSEVELLNVLWPILRNRVEKLPSSIPDELLLNACESWIEGESFINIYENLKTYKFGRYNATIEHVVDLCERCYGYSSSMLLGTVASLLNLAEDYNPSNAETFLILQKRLKYGLPDTLTVSVYELGLSDRALAIEIAEIVRTRRLSNFNRRSLMLALRRRSDEITELINANYPAYFEYKFRELINI